MPYRVLLAVLLVLCCGHGTVAVGEAPASTPEQSPAAPALFEDGDVVVFIGDSITHSRKYHAYLHVYYLTRFPERRVRFVNAGIAGDHAGGALARLAWDVLPHEATVASVMLGMNDVDRGQYREAAANAEALTKRRAAFERYQRDMPRIIQALRAAGVPRVILVTSTPYDQTAVLETPSAIGVNDALAGFAAFLRDLAAREQTALVDLHTPMTQLNATRQKADPAFTLIGRDRIHPSDPGQLVMAYLYLQAQGAPAAVSSFEIDAAKASVIRRENGRISDLTIGDNRITFTCEEDALPFPIDRSARQALELVPLVEALNQQRLVVDGLQPGQYRLRVDAEEVGHYTAEELGRGINLAMNPAMPQVAQAQAVLSLAEKHRQAALRVRTHAQVRIMLENEGVNRADDAAVNGYFKRYLEKLRDQGGSTNYFEGQFETYRQVAATRDAIEKELEQMLQELWRINQPVPHRYELIRLPS